MITADRMLGIEITHFDNVGNDEANDSLREWKTEVEWRGDKGQETEQQTC